MLFPEGKPKGTLQNVQKAMDYILRRACVKVRLGWRAESLASGTVARLNY